MTIHFSDLENRNTEVILKRMYIVKNNSLKALGLKVFITLPQELRNRFPLPVVWLMRT
jgi:hypothetical protein